MRRSNTDRYGCVVSTFRLPLHRMPEAQWAFRMLGRCSTRGVDSQRGKARALVSIFREGASRILWHLRLNPILGSDFSGLDSHRNGGIRYANRHDDQATYLCS